MPSILWVAFPLIRRVSSSSATWRAALRAFSVSSGSCARRELARSSSVTRKAFPSFCTLTVVRALVVMSTG
jgi:hypothetical protein